MSNIQLGLLIMGGVSALSAVIMYWIYSVTVNDVCLGTAILLSVLSLVCPMIAVHLPSPPEKRYQHLLRNVNEAEKELQKFLIDHPEFKECE